jgi:hypothetical protein
MIGGRQVWTVRLRKGVLVSRRAANTPAYELTAADVVYSLYANRLDREFCAYAGDYEGLTFCSGRSLHAYASSLKKPTSATFCSCPS